MNTKPIILLLAVVILGLSGCLRTDAGTHLPDPDPPPVETEEPTTPGEPDEDPDEPGEPGEDPDEPGEPGEDPDEPGEPGEDPDEPGEPEEDSDEPGEPEDEPGSSVLSLSFPSDLSNLPVGADGASAVQRIEVRVFSRDTGFAEEAVLYPGVPAMLTLPNGQYEVASGAFGADPFELLAYSHRGLWIRRDLAVDDLRLEAVIGRIELQQLAPGPFAPGEELGFRLRIIAADGTASIPAGAVAVSFAVTGGHETGLDESAGILTVEAGHGDALEVTASVRGLTGTHGTPARQSLSTSVLLPLQSGPDTQWDWLPPVVRFDPITVGTFVLTGSATDDTGLAKLEVFDGGDLIGSTDPAEYTDDPDVEAIGFPDPDLGTWTLDWRAEPGHAYTLRAVATDVHGNAAAAFQSVNVPAPDDTDDITSYRTLVSVSAGLAPETFENLGECAANEFSLPGQGLQAVGAGLQAVGAVGGLSYAPVAPNLEPTAREQGRDHTSVLTNGPIGTQYVIFGDVDHVVAILVVDDFGEPGSEVHLLHNALVTGEMTPMEFRQEVENGGITHGALVLHTILESLRGMTNRQQYQPPERSNPTTGQPYYVFEDNTVQQPVPAAPFLVQTVNTAGLTVDQLGDAIRASVAGLGSLPQGEAPTRIVVNLSFVVMPCSITEDFVASGIGSFEDYAEAVAAVNGMQGQADQVVGATGNAAGGYGLSDYFDCPSGNANDCTGGDFAGVTHLLHVASAGNFGLGYPLLPAAEPSVIAVSAIGLTDAYGPGRSAWSNSGNVMLPGTLLLSEYGGMAYRYAGTSFAAPNLSAFLAGDLSASDGRRCFLSESEGQQPVPDSFGIPVLAGSHLQDAIFYDRFSMGNIDSVMQQDCDSPYTRLDA